MSKITVECNHKNRPIATLWLYDDERIEVHLCVYCHKMVSIKNKLRHKNQKPIWVEEKL